MPIISHFPWKNNDFHTRNKQKTSRMEPEIKQLLYNFTPKGSSKTANAQSAHNLIVQQPAQAVFFSYRKDTPAPGDRKIDCQHIRSTSTKSRTSTIIMTANILCRVII